MKEIILITGVTGFIGRYLSNFLYKCNFDIIGFGKTAIENSPGNYFLEYSNDLSIQNFSKVISDYNISCIIHCAGRSSVAESYRDPEDDYLSGPHLTQKLLNCIRLNPKNTRFLFFSSAAVYGNPKILPLSEESAIRPISNYGYNKYLSEITCLQYNKIYNIPTTIVRVFSAYGIGLKRQVIWDIVKKLQESKTIIMKGTGQETRDFIHIQDICEAIYCILTKSDFSNDIYNLASGTETSIKEITNKIISILSNDNIKFNFDNNNPNGNPLFWKSDISKIQRLGFKSKITIEDGLKQYLKWALLEYI
jgi:UDP-glucose 4-epimerase